MQSIFENVQNELEIRDKRKEEVSSSLETLRNLVKRLSWSISQIHHQIEQEDLVMKLFSEIDDDLQKTNDIWNSIKEAVGTDKVEQWGRLWQRQLSDLCFVIALKHWILKRELITPEAVSTIINCPLSNDPNKKDNDICLDLETYLNGVCGLPK